MCFRECLIVDCRLSDDCYSVNREEAESATEFTAMDPAGAPGGAVRLGPDALGVQGNTVRRNIRSFDDA